MAVDIAKVISANDIKNGTGLVYIHGMNPLAANHIDDLSAISINTPAITTIEEKYDDRFDD